MCSIFKETWRLFPSIRYGKRIMPVGENPCKWHLWTLAGVVPEVLTANKRRECISPLLFFFVINNSSYMFQFKQNDRILTLGEMDAIVAEFWGVEVDPKWYACPNDWPTMNWFDCIGHGIEDLQYIYTLDREDNRKYYHGINGTNEFKMEKVIAMVMFNSMAYASFKGMPHTPSIYKPFIELCEHLDKLGITGIGLGW